MEVQIKNHAVRDYTKPIMLNLHGKEGYKTYLKIVTTKPDQYDAEAAKEIAAEKLRKQGLEVW